MEEINKWLDEVSPDFDQGFTLFQKYSRNVSLAAFIGRRRHMEMLVYELGKLANNTALKPNPHYRGAMDTPTPVEKVQKVIVDDRKISREDLPEELKPVYDKNVVDYKELRVLHEKMKQANSDIGRAEFREKIVKINEDIKKRWLIIDTGEFPEDKPKQANINSARAYISKMMKKDSLTNHQRELVKEKFDFILQSGEAIKPETLAKLKQKGF